MNGMRQLVALAYCYCGFVSGLTAATEPPACTRSAAFAKAPCERTLAIPARRSGAEGPSASHEAGLFLGGLFADETLPLSSGVDGGFRYGYQFAARSWVEFETGVTDQVEFGGLLGHAQISLRWHTSGAQRAVRPFLLVGAGVAWFNEIGVSEFSPLVAVGAGADFRWHRSLAFRLDLRDLVMTDMIVSRPTHNLQVVWGPVFRF